MQPETRAVRPGLGNLEGAAMPGGKLSGDHQSKPRAVARGFREFPAEAGRDALGQAAAVVAHADDGALCAAFPVDGEAGCAGVDGIAHEVQEDSINLVEIGVEGDCVSAFVMECRARFTDTEDAGVHLLKHVAQKEALRPWRLRAGAPHFEGIAAQGDGALHGTGQALPGEAHPPVLVRGQAVRHELRCGQCVLQVVHELAHRGAQFGKAPLAPVPDHREDTLAPVVLDQTGADHGRDRLAASHTARQVVGGPRATRAHLAEKAVEAWDLVGVDVCRRHALKFGEGIAEQGFRRGVRGHKAAAHGIDEHCRIEHALEQRVEGIRFVCLFISARLHTDDRECCGLHCQGVVIAISVQWCGAPSAGFLFSRTKTRPRGAKTWRSPVAIQPVRSFGRSPSGRVQAIEAFLSVTACYSGAPETSMAERPVTLFPLYLAICAVPAAAGLFFQPGSWYRDLDKPTWTPPDRLFPIIWAILYILMSLAAARVAGRTGNDLALGLWALQITISTLWSAVFFGLHRIRAGAVVIALLWAAVLATTLAFLRHDILAAVMMVPYLAWGTFALALNISVLRRNPGNVAAVASTGG